MWIRTRLLQGHNLAYWNLSQIVWFHIQGIYVNVVSVFLEYRQLSYFGLESYLFASDTLYRKYHHHITSNSKSNLEKLSFALIYEYHHITSPKGFLFNHFISINFCAISTWIYVHKVFKLFSLPV